MHRVRAAALDIQWRTAVAAGQWAAACTALYGFNDDDIKSRLRALTVEQILALRAVAASNPPLMALIEIGSANFTNATDTGNAYTSNAMVLRDGVLITKEVTFVSAGTFAAGKFDALRDRVVAAVTSYMTGKQRLRGRAARGRGGHWGRIPDHRSGRAVGKCHLPGDAARRIQGPRPWQAVAAMSTKEARAATSVPRISC